MKQIVIDRNTRSEVQMLFGLNSAQMTHVLRYELNSIRARKVRSYIMNFRDYHLVSNNN
jgi:hypothetical protein